MLNKNEYKKQLELYTSRKNTLKFDIYTNKNVKLDDVLTGIYVKSLRLKLEYYYNEYTANRNS